MTLDVVRVENSYNRPISCRYCGAVPCSLDHDEVNDSRIKDLHFVREIVTAKKELEQEYIKVTKQLKQSHDLFKCHMCVYT